MQGAEGMADGDQGPVGPAVPGPALEMGQAHGLLHLPVVVLDPPAELGTRQVVERTFAWPHQFKQLLIATRDALTSTWAYSNSRAASPA